MLPFCRSIVFYKFVYLLKKHIIDLDIVGDGGKVALDRHGELENLDYAEEREEHANNHFQRWNDFIHLLSLRTEV